MNTIRRSLLTDSTLRLRTLGPLAGASRYTDDAGKLLFRMDLKFQVNLDNNDIDVLQPVFQQHGISLSDDATISVETPQSLWIITQTYSGCTVCKDTNYLSVYAGQLRRINGTPNGRQISFDENGSVTEVVSYKDGQVTAITEFNDNQIRQKVQYQDKQLNGPVITYRDEGTLLFRMPLVFEGELDSNKIAPLQLEFKKHGVNLSDQATVSIETEDNEWLITQPDRGFTVNKGQEFLFSLLLGCQFYFECGDVSEELQRAFEIHGITLSSNATISTKIKGREWVIIDKENKRRYDVRREDDQLNVYTPDRLLVYVGRLLQIAQYKDGKLNGQTTVYDKCGWVSLITNYSDNQVTQVSQKQGAQLNGTVISYRDEGQYLFTLPPTSEKDLNDDNIEALQPEFEKHQICLSDQATVQIAAEDTEWIIEQPVTCPTYTVSKIEDILPVEVGRLSQIANYKGGKLSGKAALFDKNGWVTQTIHFADGLQDGVTKAYTEGLLTSKTHYKQGQKSGKLITYSQDGQKVSVSQYADNQLNGELFLYKDGEVQSATNYKDGLKDGESISYDLTHSSPNNGQPISISRYTAGKLNGESDLYFPDGEIQKQSFYEDNKLNGEVIDYYQSGVIRQTSNYENNKLDGFTFLYNEDGDLTELKVYVDGLLVLDIKISYKTDGEVEQISIKQIQKIQTSGTEGVVAQYDNGNLIELKGYEDNRVTVDVTIEYNSGQTAEKLTIEWYDESGELTEQQIYEVGKKPSKTSGAVQAKSSRESLIGRLLPFLKK